ncbi:MAG: hypothetical protein V8S96_10065 [Lachnospiraceae bacterium]
MKIQVSVIIFRKTYGGRYDGRKAGKLAESCTACSRSRAGALSDLKTGYDPAEKSWDLIVKYTGDIQRLAAGAVQITELLGGYAVVTLPEVLVEPFSRQPEITYVEKPKGLCFASAEGRQESCVNGLQTGAAGLFGAGIMIAVIDSGIDYRLEDFRNRDGTSRIDGSGIRP